MLEGGDGWESGGILETSIESEGLEDGLDDRLAWKEGEVEKAGEPGRDEID